MKKLLLLIITTMCLSSCTMGLYQYSEQSFVGDFKRYIVNDFVVSVTATGYTYTPVADISIDFNLGQYDINSAKSRDFVKKYNITDVGKIMDGKFYPSYDYMLAALVDKAKQLGATGLLNFKITPFYKSVSSAYANYSYLERYTASGFAVSITDGSH